MRTNARPCRARQHGGPSFRIVEQDVVPRDVAADADEIRAEYRARLAETNEGDLPIFRRDTTGGGSHLVALARAVGAPKLESLRPGFASAASTDANHFFIALL